MCGIIGYIGNKDAYRYLLDGLITLQNRGYDSAGIVTNNNKKFFLKKIASIDNKDSIDELSKYDNFFKGNVGIGHTRWATHGGKTDINSHPHFDNSNKISIVHNGIIENYTQIKNDLIDKNYVFHSETDTEVIVNLLSYYYNIYNDMAKAINIINNIMEGTWALCILHVNDPENIWVTRHGSPLLIGKSEDCLMVSSEKTGFVNNINSYFSLNNNDIINLQYKNEKILIHTNNSIQFKELVHVKLELTPYPYKTWTEKEIREQPDAVLRACNNGGRLFDNNIVLGGLESNKNELLNISNLIILGCGTSLHAGLYSVELFKKISGFNSVNIYDGAEFNEFDIIKNGYTGIIFLSQSGETKDLHRCIDIGKNNNCLLIGVVNVVDSMIARETDCGVYLNAGREVGVASTKSFTNQVLILSMISVWFAQKRNINETIRKHIIDDIRLLSNQINYIINNEWNKCCNVSKIFINSNSCFLLGKGTSEAIAKEGSLKIKEISYCHAEGYSGSALKHGPFALLDLNVPVIFINPTDQHMIKMINSTIEVKSRNSPTIGIVDTLFTDDIYDHTIIVPHNNTFSSLLMVIPLQIISFNLAIEKHLSPDKPRNLAKVVTVE
jgi:glucosamine--fructose-6-phosphate aminotransferase (isomerizing)